MPGGSFVVEMQIFDSSRQRQVDFELVATLVYGGSSRTVRATERNSALRSACHRIRNVMAR